MTNSEIKRKIAGMINADALVHLQLANDLTTRVEPGVLSQDEGAELGDGILRVMNGLSWLMVRYAGKLLADAEAAEKKLN